MADPREVSDDAVLAEARRVMEVCNACRYCEGYCAVFPAMELRRTFSDGDLHYLANLCHNCRSCFYACQYAPPHEFDLNPPRALADLRARSYREYAWPRRLARSLHRNGTLVSLVTVLALILTLLLAAAFVAPGNLFGTHTGPGAFYAVVPLPVMVWPYAAVFGFGLLALGVGFARFWRRTQSGRHPITDTAAWIQAVRDVSSLRYLGNGGAGCSQPGEAFSNARRVYHQLVMYGFALCFAATAVATIYHHLFDRVAPYAYSSLPVLLGAVGGVGLVAGCGGLAWLRFVEDREPTSPSLLGMDMAFIMLLFATALSGLALLAFRDTAAMGTLLVVHLGFVLGLFALLPYSKFVHAGYRLAALLRYAVEQRLGRAL